MPSPGGFIPTIRKNIRLLASQWCINNDLSDEAINYFLEIKHHKEAANLIAKVAIPETRDNGDHGKVLRWIGALPLKFRRHRPEMMLAHSLALGFSRGASEAKQLLDDLRSLLNDASSPWTLTDSEIAEQQCYAEVIEMLLFASEEKTDSVIKDAKAWMRKWPRASTINMAIVQVVMAYSYLSSNQFKGCPQSDYGRTHFMRSKPGRRM